MLYIFTLLTTNTSCCIISLLLINLIKKMENEKEILIDGRKKKIYKVMEILKLDDPVKYITDMYDSGMSCNQISEEIAQKTGVYYSTKGIADYIHRYGTMRSQKDAFNNAIDSGRMFYKKLEKKYLRHGLNASTRYNVLTRDKKCMCCGGNDFLEIDHIIPINQRGTNDESNLQVLCKMCNIGKYHATKHETND